jgi:hypothetical protein
MEVKMSIEEMLRLWKLLFPKSTMGVDQFVIWTLRFNEYAIRQGIAKTAIKYQRLKGDMTDEFLEKYAGAAMTRITEEQKKQGALCLSKN